MSILASRVARMLPNSLNQDKSSSEIDHARAPFMGEHSGLSGALKAPFYCPGHKGGRSLPDELSSNWASFDLNNLPDTDTLHCPTGSMRAAERLLADAYGVARSFMLVGGSSLGNMAAVMSTVGPGDTILVQRNAHKSIIAGIIHSGAVPEWITPTWDSRFGISHGLSLESVQQAIRRTTSAKALVALNPTYFGIVPDIAAIASVCHQHGVALLADEAHGPHFRFSDAYPVAAENAGADIVVQSTHKILSGLSQAAVLHVCSDRVDPARIQATVAISANDQSQLCNSRFHRLSPSTDVQEGEQRLQVLAQLADEARQRLEEIKGITCLGQAHLLGKGSGCDDSIVRSS